MKPNNTPFGARQSVTGVQPPKSHYLSATALAGQLGALHFRQAVFEQSRVTLECRLSAVGAVYFVKPALQSVSVAVGE
jgi:hypothetical protein